MRVAIWPRGGRRPARRGEAEEAAVGVEVEDAGEALHLIAVGLAGVGAAGRALESGPVAPVEPGRGEGEAEAAEPPRVGSGSADPGPDVDAEEVGRIAGGGELAGHLPGDQPAEGEAAEEVRPVRLDLA